MTALHLKVLIIALAFVARNLKDGVVLVLDFVDAPSHFLDDNIICREWGPEFQVILSYSSMCCEYLGLVPDLQLVARMWGISNSITILALN